MSGTRDQALAEPLAPAARDRIMSRARKRQLGGVVVNTRTVILIVAAIGAAFFVGPGLWALLAPESFAEQLAPYEPYNEHYVHDIGAFQIGIGAALVAALWRRSDAVFAALAGAAIGSAFHTATHFIDHDLGGKDTDVFVFGTVAIVLGAAAVLQLLRTGRGGSPSL